MRRNGCLVVSDRCTRGGGGSDGCRSAGRRGNGGNDGGNGGCDGDRRRGNDGRVGEWHCCRVGGRFPVGRCGSDIGSLRSRFALRRLTVRRFVVRHGLALVGGAARSAVAGSARTRIGGAFVHPRACLLFGIAPRPGDRVPE
ncbi:MAG: hypothetical protein KJZ98_11470 [Burkholderiaceae bacterium]|nr:hypothetical protein [Burkholderiaceae bacterium]MEB2352476.1 hypothetical protein [Burkholderiaceae bacterium]